MSRLHLQELNLFSGFLNQGGKNAPLTVELKDGVVDFTLELPGTLESARHPESLVHGYSCDDVVSDVRGHLPLRQDSPDDQTDNTY